MCKSREALPPPTCFTGISGVGGLQAEFRVKALPLLLWLVRVRGDSSERLRRKVSPLLKGAIKSSRRTEAIAKKKSPFEETGNAFLHLNEALNKKVMEGF